MSQARCLLGLLVLLISCEQVIGQNSYAPDLAKRIVNGAAEVRTGERVIVFGGTHSLPIATEISKACAAAGAVPTIIMTNDSIENLRLTDTVHFGKVQLKRVVTAMEQARVLIVLNPIVNDLSLVMQNLKASHYNRINEYEHRIRRIAQRPGVRVVYVNLATRPVADMLHVKFEDYESMLQKANLVDSAPMDANINRLSGLLKNASRIRITNPMGTNISFLISNREAIIDDGRITNLEARVANAYNRVVTLPPGILRISVIEGSGMGRVIIPESECHYEAMQQISFSINKGKIEQWNANTGGACFKEMLRLNSDDWEVGSISFSFNWEIKSINEDGLRFWREDGGPLIWITIGGNEDLGGQVSNDVRQFSFPIQRPTVEIDGKIAIKAN